MDSTLKRSPGVYLTGFMGSGKTTVARALADRLGWDFIDLDAEIESAEKATIAEIFESRGELEFRRIETETIRRVMHTVERGLPTVIALGGGSFVQPANAAMLATRGISIWLDCPFEVIEQRITDSESRPLARDPEEFRKLYDERRAAYSHAHYRVDGACEVELAVQSILDLPFWK
jgi:shikimate kinase